MKNFAGFTSMLIMMPVILVSQIAYGILYGANNDIFNVIPRKTSIKIFGRQSLFPYVQDPNQFPAKDWNKYR